MVQNVLKFNNSEVHRRVFNQVFYPVSVSMRHGASEFAQSGSFGLRVLQPHHQHAPENVWTGSGLSGRHRLAEIKVKSFTVISQLNTKLYSFPSFYLFKVSTVWWKESSLLWATATRRKVWLRLVTVWKWPDWPQKNQDGLQWIPGRACSPSGLRPLKWFGKFRVPLWHVFMCTASIMRQY